jgi:LysR family tcuABC transcriptional regulator
MPVMELRQLRYFVSIVEHGSMGRAAQALGVVTSALSQQISRLEGELSARLLQRSAVGVTPTDAGLAFFQQAQLVLRHADDAVRAAQRRRLSGHVSVGLAPTTASVLGLPLVQAMRERYPDVRLHLVESLSGHLAGMLETRRIDLAIVFSADAARRWSVLPLLRERLFVLASADLPAAETLATGMEVQPADLAGLPLVLPTGPHGLRSTVDAVFAAAGLQPNVVLEIDSLPVLMAAVHAGIAATIQPGAAMALPGAGPLLAAPLASAGGRDNLLASLNDDELSPAALAARVTVAEVARSLVRAGRWVGAELAP